MKPLRFLTITALGYLTLLAVFGGTDTQPETTPTSVTATPILYSPIPQAPVTTLRTAVEQSTTSTTTPPQPVVLVGPDTPCQKWIPLAVKQGWPADRQILETLASVMWKESRCVAIVPGDQYFNGSDHGLLQLNNVWLNEAQTILGDAALIDTPAGNLRLGYEIWRWHEDHTSCGWQPWGLSCQ